MSQLVPDFIEVPREFRRIAEVKGRGTFRALAREGNGMLGANPTRTAAHYNDPVGHGDCLRNVVRDQDYSLAFAAKNDADLVGEGEPGLIVECREWLVEQQDVGLGDQCAGERRPLTHSAGELMRIMLHELAEAVAAQQFLAPDPCIL